jgi:hypothetical protein
MLISILEVFFNLIHEFRGLKDYPTSLDVFVTPPRFLAGSLGFGSEDCNDENNTLMYQSIYLVI